MRIGGVITVLVILALGFAAAFFITDEWVESQIEYEASVLNEAKVEIDGFQFDLMTLNIRWDRLQVANKNNTMENTFETGETEFKMSSWPLLLKNKVIVDNMQLTGFQMDTERETDGYFEVPEEERDTEPGFIYSVISQVTGEATRNAEVVFSDARDDLNVDSLMAKLNIQSLDKMDSLRTGIQGNYSKWDSTFTNTDVNAEVEEIQAKVDSIKIREIDTPQEAIAAIENVNELRQKADSLRTRAQELQNEFQKDYGSTRYSIGQVDDWIEDDYQRALSMAKLPDLSAQNIGKALFGENLLGDYAAYLEYVALAREYGSRLFDDDEAEIPRYEGIDFDFTDKYDFPGFWFKNIKLSGTTNAGLSLSGQLENVSSAQSKTGQPLTFELGGRDENNVSLSLNGEFNYLEETPRESFVLNYDGFTLSKARLSGSELLPYELQSGIGELNVEFSIIGRRLDSRIDYLTRDLSFNFESAGEPNNRLESLVRTAIGSTDNIDITALIDNMDGPLRVRVRSNVDELFMNALRQTVSQEIELARQRIEAEVQSRVEGKKEELAAFKEEKEAEIRARYDTLQAKVQEQIDAVEAKKEELEEKKKELEDAIRNRIRNRIGIDG